MLLGKRANSGMAVSFSHIRTHKIQEVNLQWKRIFWPEGNTYVKLRLSTKAIKTLKSKVCYPLRLLI
jgi:large subunit ribosomal protein L28